jgi:hypothetical protein
LSEDVAAGGPLTTWADTEPGNGGRRFYSILVLP